MRVEVCVYVWKGPRPSAWSFECIYIHIRERGGCSIYAKMTLTHQFNMEQDNLANARRRRYDVVYSTQCMHFALLYSINTDAAPKIHFLPRAFYIYV